MFLPVRGPTAITSNVGVMSHVGHSRQWHLKGSSVFLTRDLYPLTALDAYIRPKTVVACIGYSASYSQNLEKPTVFDGGENLLQNGIQHFAIKLSQSSAIAF